MPSWWWHIKRERGKEKKKKTDEAENAKIQQMQKSSWRIERWQQPGYTLATQRFAGVPFFFSFSVFLVFFFLFFLFFFYGVVVFFFLFSRQQNNNNEKKKTVFFSRPFCVCVIHVSVYCCSSSRTVALQLFVFVDFLPCSLSKRWGGGWKRGKRGKRGGTACSVFEPPLFYFLVLLRYACSRRETTMQSKTTHTHTHTMKLVHQWKHRK